MFSNIEKNMEVGLAAIPPWLKELIALYLIFEKQGRAFT